MSQDASKTLNPIAAAAMRVEVAALAKALLDKLELQGASDAIIRELADTTHTYARAVLLMNAPRSDGDYDGMMMRVTVEFGPMVSAGELTATDRRVLVVR